MKRLLFCTFIILNPILGVSQNLYNYILQKHPELADTTILKKENNSVLLEKEYYATDLFYKIKYVYFADNSLQIKFYYKNYILTFLRVSKNNVDIPKLKGLFKNGSSQFINDSQENISIENVFVKINSKTKCLLEYSRFKCISDTIDFNSFNQESIRNAESYDFLLTSQWYQNGISKTSLIKNNNQYLYFKYANNGEIHEIDIYQNIKNEFDEEEFKFIEKINLY